ncbi:MAG: Eco57I restriction-modification methylase domain-containing protein, partial [Terriglobia bacterium]
MAVQLARLSLWLATLAADRPLSFLDHRLQVGDSLLGIWLAQLRHAPSTRPFRGSETTLPLFADQVMSEALGQAVPIRFALETTPTDTVEQVRAKERAFADLTARHATLSRWKRIAHLWCSNWFAAAGHAAPASAFGPLSDAALTGKSSLPWRTAARYLDAADAIGEARRFFHWELEFPEVFFDGNGSRRAQPGFDAVIGNPPYIRYQQHSGTSRAKSLEAALAEGVRLNGLASSWAAFTVHSTRFLKPGGRLGLVLPAELLSVNYAAPVRRFLLQRFSRVRLVMFESLVFPGALEEVVLLLAEGSGGADCFEVYQARDLAALPLARTADWKEHRPEQGAKWTSALLTPALFDSYKNLSDSEDFETLSDWGETYLGAVTGNNDFFSLSKSEVSTLGLSEDELVPISPPGSRHLRGHRFTSAAWVR